MDTLLFMGKSSGVDDSFPVDKRATLTMGFTQLLS